MKVKNTLISNTDSFAQHVFELYAKAIYEYHLIDHINQRPPDLKVNADLKEMFHFKCWIDAIQWHTEDEIRRQDINPEYALYLKRKIDSLNQERTNIVESIDVQILLEFNDVVLSNNAKINTETPGWALDRLSVLALKIYHMDFEANRKDVSVEHLKKCQMKLDILKEQKKDLLLSINELLSDLKSGVKLMKLYNQMKMYNDPSLNPVLYQDRIQ